MGWGVVGRLGGGIRFGIGRLERGHKGRLDVRSGFLHHFLVDVGRGAHI